MRVAFLQDNGINESLSLTDIAGLLHSKGHECELFFERNEKNIFGAVKAFGPNLIVLPLDIWGEKAALGMAAKINKFIAVPTVVCGTFPLLYPEIIEHPEINIVSLGESEFAILDLVERLRDGKDYADVPNLLVKTNGDIRRNELRPLLQDLTALPLPRREIYYKYLFMRDLSLKRFTSGRGCPNSCGFCYNAEFRRIYHGKGKYLRRKPVGRIIEEIDAMKRNFPLRSAHFSDDLFTDDREWIFKFSEEYGKRFATIPFTCNTTVNMVSDDMLKAMKRAGCHGLAIGVETGREWLRVSELNKPFTDEEIYRTAALIKENDLELTIFTMIGLPRESVDDMFATIAMCRKINADNVRATFLSPIPRTRMTDRAVKDGILKASYEEQSESGKLLTPVFNHTHRREISNLFFLFEAALKSPFWEKFVRFIIRFPLPPVIRLSLLLRLYREKKFFNISLWSGFMFFLKTTFPQNRTKNYNNYLP